MKPILAYCGLCFAFLGPISIGRTSPLDDPKDLAIEKVKTLRGTITLDEKAEGKPVVSITLANSLACDDDLNLFRDLTTLQVLDLSDNPITDKGLLSLKDLTRLERLDLSGTKA
jgi:Leucine-rich repeat (LRR) protein